MSTTGRYAIPTEMLTWDVEAAGATRFNWEYDDGRARLRNLYQKRKDKQGDATTRIEWSLDIDPGNPLGTPLEAIPLFGSRAWEKIRTDLREVDRVRLHSIA